jgi:predicted transcriptional regulator
MRAKSNSRTANRALSVRQPLAEQIMTGKKKIEYRSIPTNIRGRVYIYASKTPNLEVYKKLKKVPGDFPVGVLVGTVEIIDCKEKPDEYQWTLDKPERLKNPIKPDKHPQPVWFKPFKE